MAQMNFTLKQEEILVILSKNLDEAREIKTQI